MTYCDYLSHYVPEILQMEAAGRPLNEIARVLYAAGARATTRRKNVTEKFVGRGRRMTPEQHIWSLRGMVLYVLSIGVGLGPPIGIQKGPL